MYSIVGSVVTFYICFAVGTPIAADNGYIYEEMPSIPCKDPSSAISPCSSSLAYKIPDFSNNKSIGIPFKDIPAFVRNSTLSGISFFRSASEECKKGGTKFICETAYPYRCKDAYVERDSKKIRATCDEARKACSSSDSDRVPRDLFLNCSSSSFATNFGSQYRYPPKLSCFAFPVIENDPYKCENNYKVYVGTNETDLKEAAKSIASLHTGLKSSNISDVECEKNVADVICKASIPACSRDQTKLVSILSKQDCRKIVGCLNKTNQAPLIQGAHGLCDRLPDGTTAKKYPLENVYDNIVNKAVGHAMAFSTIWFIAAFVGSSFY